MAAVRFWFLTVALFGVTVSVVSVCYVSLLHELVQMVKKKINLVSIITLFLYAFFIKL